MDIEATLAELRTLTARTNAEWDARTSTDVVINHDAYRFAELFAALDEWITGKGFLPKDWRQR